MAISATHLTQGVNGASQSSYATASVTPTANRLVLAVVGNKRSAGSPTLPTASGCSLTWVEVATKLSNTIATPLSRLTLFRAMGTPTAGAITFDFGGTAQTAAVWTVTEFANVNQTGTNGSGAVIQSATNAVDASTSLTVTLAAFASAANGAFFVCGNATGVANTPDTGWTEIDDQNGLESQWRADNDTTAVASFTSSDAAGIAIEIAVPSVTSGFLLAFARNRRVR